MLLANDCIGSYCTMLKAQVTHFSAGKKDSLAESSMREQCKTTLGMELRGVFRGVFLVDIKVCAPLSVHRFDQKALAA